MTVQTGLSRLFEDPTWSAKLQGRRVGLLVNHASVDAKLRHALDLALAAGWKLDRVFAPEHGPRGVAQDMEGVQGGRDPITGLPYVSLYGHDRDSLAPTREAMEGLDVLVMDLQDVGARYYTYVYTAAFCAEVATSAGVEVLLCDRPNPLGGDTIEGNLVHKDYRSFVDEFAIATRHGMTWGELLRYFVRFEGLKAELEVVPMQGWLRRMHYEDTKLPWVMPSPNMPTVDTAFVYPGQCLLEGTNLSEARGTTRPFELCGAPYVDSAALRASLEEANLDGCMIRDVSFKPMFQKHAGAVCNGVQFHVTDRASFRSVEASLHLLQALMKLHHDDFGWRTEAYEFVSDRLAIDLLLGDPLMRHALRDGTPIPEVLQAMAADRHPFEQQRAEVLLYGDG